MVISEALPSPGGPVPARELAAFKDRHSEALLRCRRFLDAKIADLAATNEPAHREIRLARNHPRDSR